MESIIKYLAPHGPFALIAGGLIWLLIILWRRFDDILQRQHDALVEDTKMKGNLTKALEDVVESIETVGCTTNTEVLGCKQSNIDLTKKIESYLDRQRLERAKEAGRREATNPHGVPIYNPEGESK